LRSRDTSRDEEAWGAIVPVVGSDRLHSDSFSITDVPVSDGFRATLRIYDADPTTTPVALVRYYELDPHTVHPEGEPDVLLSETTIGFVMPPANTSPYCPAYAELVLPTAVTASLTKRLRIEIVPKDDHRDYWGFVSVTNNKTQEVSILAPN
jgi:hypothetical protein